MTNADVARIFDEVADLLEIDGAETFRIVTYRRVARTIGDLPRELADYAAAGELESLPGIGKGSAAKIRELLDSGKLALRDELLQRIPAGVLELLRIPGLGPKKAAVLLHERKIDSLAALQAAIDAGTLTDLKGFGARSIEKLSAGIAFLQRSGGRTRLGNAWPLAETFREAVSVLPGVRRVEHAGSLRRGCDTVGDLDLLCVADNGPDVVQRFTQLPGVVQVLAAGPTKGSVQVEWAAERTIQVDLRVVPGEAFGAAWQYFTGSKEHNVRLRELATRRGWSLNEYALHEGERVIAAATEEEVYAALGLPWIPPELREDRGEFELQESPDDLLREEDVRGDLHMHTTASDGRNSIEEMALAAKARGYEYVCITDHSAASVVANGLSVERMTRHLEAVRAADKRIAGITILAGAEVDIHADGRLDYPDELLEQMDWVIASNHQHMSADRDANTQRAVAALRHPCVNLLAHPTGRVLGRRDGMPLDLDAVIAAARENGAALEINASLFRLDLKDQYARAAGAAGVPLACNTDAHAINDLAHMRYGVLTARRAWLTRRQVVNAWPLKQLRAFVRAKRSG